MQFTYGFRNGIVRQSIIEYQHRYPNIKNRTERRFIEIHRQPRYGLRGYLFDTGLSVLVDVDKQVIDAITRDQTASVRRTCRRIGVLRMTVWRY